MISRGFRPVHLVAGALTLSLMCTACASELASRAEGALKRLTESVTWSLSEQPGQPGGCNHVGDVEMCGALILRVRATDDVVLAGPPEIVRKNGFSNRVRTKGCRDCPQEPTVIGEDAAGRELAITVYPLEGGLSMLDAYVSAPKS